MSNELAPEGPELQPDLMDDLASEETASEESAHLVPPIRQLPADIEFLPAVFYSVRIDDGSPGDAPQTLGDLLGQALFQSLTDIHVFGRAGDDEPFLEVGPTSPEPPQILVAQELYLDPGEPLAADDLGMFEMIAGRIAKTLKRERGEPEESADDAVARAQALAGLKGKFQSSFAVTLTGDFEAPALIDACLCLGMKRDGGNFGWHGGLLVGGPIFTVAASGLELKAGATGKASSVEFRFKVAAVRQPRKVLERMMAAANWFKNKIGGEIKDASGAPTTDEMMRGEHADLETAIQEIEDAGLRPGHAITRRLA